MYYNLNLLNQNDFVMQDDILRQRNKYSLAQEQSQSCFSYKWNKTETYQSNTVHQASYEWLIEKYGGRSEIFRIIPPNSLLLDAGCGAGFRACLKNKNCTKSMFFAPFSW